MGAFKRLQLKQDYPWLIWGLGASFFFLEYVARVSPSVMTHDLMKAFSVDALSLGALSAFFYYAYVSMQIPVGTLIDRFGPHRLLTLTAGMAAVGCFIFANANTLGMAEAGRFLMGFGGAFAFVGTLKLATIWFSPTRFGLLAGLTQGIGMLGAATGQGPLAWLVEKVGWQHAVWLVGGLLFVLAILIGFIVSDGEARKQLKVESYNPPFWRTLFQVLKNPQTWFNALYVGLLFAPTAAFAELWGTSYLSKVYDLSNTEGASGISMIFIGWTLGGPIAGWISDLIQRRKPVMIASALMSLFFMSLILYLPHLNSFTLFVLLFLYGTSNVGVVTAYAVALENNSQKVAGTSLGFANMASVIIGAGFQPLIGALLVFKSSGVIQDGVPIYTAGDYRFAMLSLPLCLIVSFGMTFLIKETHCKMRAS